MLQIDGNGSGKPRARRRQFRRRQLDAVPEWPEVELAQLQQRFSQTHFHEHSDRKSSVVWGEWRCEGCHVMSPKAVKHTETEEAGLMSSGSEHGPSQITATPVQKADCQFYSNAPPQRSENVPPRSADVHLGCNAFHLETQALPPRSEHGHLRSVAEQLGQGGIDVLALDASLLSTVATMLQCYRLGGLNSAGELQLLMELAQQSRFVLQRIERACIGHHGTPPGWESQDVRPSTLLVQPGQSSSIFERNAAASETRA